MSDQRITTIVLSGVTLDALRRLAVRRAELHGGRASASEVVRDLIEAEARRAKILLDRTAKKTRAVARG